MIVSSTIIDEGASVSILSSTTWKSLGSPSLMHVTQNLLGFNKGTSRPLGILRKITNHFRKENYSSEHDGSPRTVRLQSTP